MVILRFRNDSDAKELMGKLKKMYKFTKELIDCVEEKYEDEENYRYDDDDEPAYRGRYRRGM